jgi:O-antigen/teichoic acid export membrane protein
MKPPLKNLGSLFLGDAGSRVIGFLITAYLARVLAPSAFGVLNIGLAVLGHLMIVGSPGIQVVEVRNVAAGRDGLPRRVGAVLSLRCVMALVLLGLTWLVSAVAVSDAVTRDVIRLYAAALVPYALLLDWYFQGKEDFLRLGLSRLLTYLVFGAAALLLVRSADDVRSAALAFLIGTIVATLFLGVAYTRAVKRPTMSWDLDLWASILRENLPVGLALFLAQVVSNFPPLVIGGVLDTASVGQYSAALKIVFLILLLDRLFNALFLPIISRYLATRQAEAPFLVTVTLKVVLVLLLPVVVCGFVLAEMAIMLVFGDGYAAAAPLLRIMMGFVVFTVLNSLFVCLLVGSGREKVYSRSMMIGTGILAIAAVVLTPLFGTAGTAVALVLGEFCTLVLMAHGALPSGVVPRGGTVVRPLVAALVMVAVVWLLKSLNPFAASGAGMVAYAVFSVAFPPMTGDEVRFLRDRIL